VLINTKLQYDNHSPFSNLTKTKSQNQSSLVDDHTGWGLVYDRLL